MDLLPITIRQIRLRVAIFLAGVQSLLILVCYVSWKFAWLTSPQSLIIAGAVSAATTSILASFVFGWYAKRLLESFGRAVLHISPSVSVQAPNLENLPIAREFMTALVYQLYQIASLQDNKQLAEHKREATQASNILTHLPLPVLVFNKQQIVTYGTDAALTYCGLESAQLFGKSLFEVVDLDFPSEFTLEDWIQDCQQNKATDATYWRRVRMSLKGEDKVVRQFDMAGYYNRDNPSGIEFIITMFDRTQEYQQDDDSLSFVALAVHELRTPLTLMRGYIEVFEDELEGKLNTEMSQFMQRLHGAAEQLATFVNNILNTARIDNNQLTVKLHEENWADTIKHAGADMELRAHALGKTINYDIAPDLPTVAVDRVTMYEVICNLLDNAIKYSGKSPEIIVKTHTTKDGLVETTVEDKGVGIPTSVMPSLFEKFHRNHRNQDQISGTGLGLYLSKAIVTAHGGDIWVNSKEGEGTTVGFTIRPYSMLADELKTSNNKEDVMIRTAHGWIKNHSLYRR